MHPESLDIPTETADTLERAQERYERFRNVDPFPDIPPALLNSADIYDYVRATGMIHPFERRRLNKPASYEVSIGRRYIYWDAEGRNVDRYLEDGEEFVLAPNSIGFVVPEEFFQLPNYIAARFNLRITNVHRGLLLGTGPLVDPGFPGRLLVPLHNLTTNEYRFRQGEEFAWFEFTKLSPHTWDPRYEILKKKYSLRGEFVPFPQEKIDIARDPRKYLYEASRRGVRSSIPEAIRDSEENARRASEDAKDAAERAQTSSNASERAARSMSNIGVGAGIAGLIAVVVLFVAVVALWYSSSQLALQVNESVVTLRESYDELQAEAERGLASLAEETRTLASNIEDFQSSVGVALPEMQSRLDLLHSEVERLRNEISEGETQQ